MIFFKNRIEKDKEIEKKNNLKRSVFSNTSTFGEKTLYLYFTQGSKAIKHVYDNQTVMLEKSTYSILEAQSNQLNVYECAVNDAEVNPFFLIFSIWFK